MTVVVWVGGPNPVPELGPSEHDPHLRLHLQPQVRPLGV